MADPPSMLMTSDEACELLKISRAHLYRLCRERRIPHSRLTSGTGPIRFHRGELEQWLATRYQPVVQ